VGKICDCCKPHHNRKFCLNQLRQLLEVDQLPQHVIAERFGVARSTIERTAKRHGMKTCRSGPRHGQEHPDWNGGRRIGKLGYVDQYAPLHPFAKKPVGYVAEHRMIMEVMLGRYLTADEVVDHRDNHPRHNWPDNLRLFDSNGEHLHQTLRPEWYGNSPRRLIPYAHPCSQGTDHLIDISELLARFPENMQKSYLYHIEIHQPNSKHAHLAKIEFLREGASSTPFQLLSE